MFGDLGFLARACVLMRNMSCRCSNLEMIGQVLEFGDDLGFRKSDLTKHSFPFYLASSIAMSSVCNLS